MAHKLPFTCCCCGNGTIVENALSTTTGKRRVRECTTCKARFTTFQELGGLERVKVIFSQRKPAETTPALLVKMRRSLIREMLWDVKNIGRVMPSTRGIGRAIKRRRGG